MGKPNFTNMTFVTADESLPLKKFRNPPSYPTDAKPRTGHIYLDDAELELTLKIFQSKIVKR
jgi:hypothetical protein